MGWWPKCGMDAGSPEARRAVRRLTWWSLALAMLTAIGMVAAARIIKSDADLSAWVRVALGLSPILPFAAMLAVFVRMSRYFDEFVVRVQFEAVSMTLLISLLGLFAWGQLQNANVLAPAELDMAWPAVAFIYGISTFLAARRYR